MKMTDVTPFVVANPPTHHGGRYFIFVKLITDNGIEGIGEVYVAIFSPHVVVEMIKDVFEHNIVDQDPFQIEKCGKKFTLVVTPAVLTSG